MNGLMLHCGGQLKSREEVFAVPVPQATASYVPLSYERTSGLRFNHLTEFIENFTAS